MSSSFELFYPKSETTIPLVFDSPHSGMGLPDDFQSDVPKQQIQTGWDAFIEDLWSGSVDHGAHLLHALFSRMYIDPNRAPNDIDPEVVEQQQMSFQPTKYSERGMGLIRRYALPEIPLYNRKLTERELQVRLHDYYLPYHNTLANLLDKLHQKFGAVWHIDCHSMKSVGNKMNIDAGAARPDIILGDNEGLCASGEFVSLIEHAFVSRGYSVVRNDPYKGGYLINQYSNIKDKRHSMQIEINRSLYMNEKEFTKNENYDKFKADLAGVAYEVSQYVRAKIATL